MIPVEEALRIVGEAAGAPRARPETVPLARALGRVLAQDVAMDRDVPSFDRSTMDGYAVRTAGLPAPPAVLPVLEHVTAGAMARRTVGPGQSVAITTGAPIPEGADAVVPLEATRPEPAPGGAEAVRILKAVSAGQNVSRRAEQAARGEVVLRAGTRVHPGTVGVLAAAGATQVVVAARPRVRVIGTGDELVPAGETPGPACLRDSNGHALAAQAEHAGAQARYDGPVPDDRRALARAVEAGLEDCDLLCLCGGVSLGERDLVPAVLASLHVERLFHRWAVKPGGPLWAGRLGDRLVFGLPGNPAAAFVGFELLVVPALGPLLGREFRPRASLRALFDGTTGPAIPRRQYVPVRIEHDGTAAIARPVRWTGSGDLFGLAAADALAAIPEEARVERARTVAVEAIPLREGP